MSSSDQEHQPTHHYHHQFRWDSSVPQQVLIKGSFDQWQSSLELIKEPSGKFGRSIELDHGSRVSYKYIIDGVWRHNPNEPTETDSNGNINNVFEVPEYLPSESQHSDQESQPEPNPLDSQADQTSEPTEDKDLINTAVFPTQSPQRIPSTSQSTPPSTRLPTKSMIGSRTHSLISQSRSRHTSYHSPSFLGSTIAPGTPTEKSTPAQTSVSTVVSAMAGAAATAIPAAIFAVTGKDIIRNRSSSASASARSMPVSINKANVDRNVSLPNSTPGQKIKSDIQEPLPILLTLNDPKENDEVVKGNPEVDTHLQLEPSQQDRSEPKVESIETQVQEVQDPKPEPELIGGGALQAIEETGSEVSQNDKADTKSKEELINQSTSVTDLPPSTEAVIQPPTSENEPHPSIPEVQPTAPGPEQVATQEVQPPPTEPVFAQPSIPTPEASTKPSPTSQTITSTTPKIPPNIDDETTSPKGKYGTLTPNRSTPQQTNKNGGWRVSIGSIGKKSSPLINQQQHEGESTVGDDPNTPIRKRKTSLFQKIKVAFSPGSHGHRKTSESTE